MKSEWLDHSLRLNLTAFYDTWSDPQETIQTYSSAAGELFNGPKIEIKGAELEINYAPVRDLTLAHRPHFCMPSSPDHQPVHSAAWQRHYTSHSAVSHSERAEVATSLSLDWILAHASYGNWRFSVQENGSATFAPCRTPH